MEVRLISASDWALLKQIRLAALAGAPTAFGVSYDTAAGYTDAQWQERAAAVTGPQFWLAFVDGRPVGMIGAGVSQTGRFNLIAMWVEPGVRGSGVAARLVDAVKARARQLGHERIYLDVAPDNARAAQFYRKHGFEFIDEWEPLASHPHIMVRTMTWTVDRQPAQRSGQTCSPV